MVFWIVVFVVVALPFVVGFVTSDAGNGVATFIISLGLGAILLLITAGVTNSVVEPKTIEMVETSITPLTNRSGVDGYVLLGVAGGDPTANYKVVGDGKTIEDYRTFNMRNVRINENKNVTKPSAEVRTEETRSAWVFPFALSTIDKVDINIPVGGIGSL